ncbi:MAG: 2'-5' RNA ligase family protein [Planctomycetota bacterium]
MAGKTHKTAVVLIPPEDVWEPIQQIRRKHDRQFRRWMPHVTLLYPFRPADKFAALARPLEQACGLIEPFEVELAEFGWFAHGPKSFTLWLSPQPAAKLIELQAAIQAVVPDCDDVRRHAGGFTPHLSVGQVRQKRRLEDLLKSLLSGWRCVRFVASQVALISRGDPPDDVFEVAQTIPLCSAGTSGQ